MLGYVLGQEREMIVTGKGHYRVGQILHDDESTHPKDNGLLFGIVEQINPHRQDPRSFLEEVWIYRPWLDGE